MTARMNLKKVETFLDLPAWFEWDFSSRRFGDASFASQSQGWILLEDLLFHTADGGQSWRFIDIHRPPGLLPTSVCADGPDSCWLTLSQTGENRPTRIPIARFDGGKLSAVTWVGATNGWYKVGSHLFFASPDRGWLMTGESVNGEESGAVFSTDDGGRSWRLTANPEGVPTSACFGDSHSGWLLVRGRTQERRRAFRVVLEAERDEEFLIGGHRYSVLSTKDGGRSWAAATSVERDLFGIVGADNTIHAFGSSGLILRSDDRGLTWGTVRSRTRSDIYAMAFNRGGWGLAVGDEGAVLYSDDCGRNWTQAKHNLRGMIFHDVHFSDERSGVVIDPEGLYRFVLH